MSGFFNLQLFLKLLASVVGTVGFAVLFGVRRKHLLFAGIGGLGVYSLFYTVAFFGGSLFASAFVSSAFAALYSEIFARIRKAPTAIFLIPSGIPIVPGGDLYYTMRYILEGNFEVAMTHLLSAFKIGLGMAGGIVAVSILWSSLIDRITKKAFPVEKKVKNLFNF